MKAEGSRPQASDCSTRTEHPLFKQGPTWIQDLFICFIFSLPVTSFSPLFLPKFNILLVIVIPCSQKCLESSLQFPSANGGCCGVGLSNCQACIFPLELEEETTDINKINTKKKIVLGRFSENIAKKNNFNMILRRYLMIFYNNTVNILASSGLVRAELKCEQPCGVCSCATT